jgi:hypothetical protein
MSFEKNSQVSFYAKADIKQKYKLSIKDFFGVIVAYEGICVRGGDQIVAVYVVSLAGQIRVFIYKVENHDCYGGRDDGRYRE